MVHVGAQHAAPLRLIIRRIEIPWLAVFPRDHGALCLFDEASEIDLSRAKLFLLPAVDQDGQEMEQVSIDGFSAKDVLCHRIDRSIRGTTPARICIDIV